MKTRTKLVVVRKKVECKRDWRVIGVGWENDNYVFTVFDSKHIVRMYWYHFLFNAKVDAPWNKHVLSSDSER